MRFPPPFGSNLKVLVPAGSNPAPPPGRWRVGECPLADKAFVRLRGRLIIEYVLEFLDECGLRQVWVVAPEAQLARIPQGYVFTGVPQPPGTGFFDTLAAGATQLSLADGEPLLVAFADHPLNSPAVLEHFLARCGALLGAADFFHALALQDAYGEFDPWFRRTSVHVREFRGRASGLSLVVPSRLHGLTALRELYGVRKLERFDSFLSLLVHLARWLGRDTPRVLLDAALVYLAKESEKRAHATGRLGRLARGLESWLADRVPAARLERYARRVLGAERGVRLIGIAHGGIALDVDFSSELEVLERHWEAIRAVADRQDAALTSTMAYSDG